MPTDQRLLSRTFVQLADSLVAEFDIIELLTLLSHRCAELFRAEAAGILLGDDRGTLQVVAASNEQARLLELLQLQNDEGPCLDCVSTGRPVIALDLELTDRWPLFVAEARGAGFRGVYAFPLRLRSRVIGTLNMFFGDASELCEDDRQLCQALADVATIAILQNQATHEAEIVSEQLQRALNSRIAIEQAKGILAERFGIEMADAFGRLRRHARDSNRKLSDLAEEIVSGRLADADSQASGPPPDLGVC